jgi:PAS domain S-box-containing protein
MEASLERQHWDAILSDYHVPGFGIEAALQIYKRHALNTPFICVSGKISEIEAVEMMRHGVHDYLMKDNLAGLGAKIQREIQAADQRAELKREQFTKSHLAAIVEHSNDAIIGTNLDGIVLSWNRAAEQIYGLPASEMLGKSVSAIVPSEAAGDLSDLLDRMRRGETIGSFQTVSVRKDGTRVDVSITVSPLKGKFGQITGVSAIVRDITERCRREEELVRLNEELKKAAANVKALSGLLPICSGCKKIRDDQGYWQQVESYIRKHSEAQFTHGLCPDCVKHLYPELKLEGSV